MAPTPSTTDHPSAPPVAAATVAHRVDEPQWFLHRALAAVDVAVATVTAPRRVVLEGRHLAAFGVSYAVVCGAAVAAVLVR